MAFDNSYWSGRACVRSVEDWGLATIACTCLHCLQHQHRLHRSAKLQTDRLEEKTIQDIMRRNEVLKEIVGTGYYQSIIYRSIKTSQYPIIKDTEKSV